MNRDEKYIALIKQRLSEQRFIHSMNVANAAAELAKKYGADEKKAYTAGILHDIMKEESVQNQLEFLNACGIVGISLNNMNPQVLHQMTGELYCRLKLGVDDKDILNAIRYHTTGRREMTLLEQVVYTADFISADRCYPDVDVMREKAKESLNEAMLYSLKYTIGDLSSKQRLIDLNTIECYNWILENFIEKE